MSQLERINTFVQVVDAQSFVAAARKKGVSVAAISKQIALLEKHLQAQLLYRTTRQLKMTKAGELFYQQCRNALNELHDAEQMLMVNKHEVKGKLHIMATRYFAINYLLPQLEQFMLDNPQLQIYFHLEERLPDLVKEEIDIIFGISLDINHLVRRRIGNTRYVLCASPQYLKKMGTPKKPFDLIHHHYITHVIRQPNDVIIFKNNIRVSVKPRLWLNDTYAMRECAIAGLGIVNLHDYMVADALRNGQLVEVLQTYQEPQQNIYLYYQQSKYLQPKIRRFIDFFVPA